MFAPRPETKQHKGGGLLLPTVPSTILTNFKLFSPIKASHTFQILKEIPGPPNSVSGVLIVKEELRPGHKRKAISQ